MKDKAPKSEKSKKTPKKAEKGTKPVVKQVKSQNTPKKYPNKGTGEVKNPRKRCPVCEKNGVRKYMIKPKYEFAVQGIRTTIKPCLICKCGYVEINWEELKKIPD